MSLATLFVVLIIWFVVFRIAVFFFRKAVIMRSRANPAAPLLLIAGIIFTIISLAILILGFGVGLLSFLESA